MNIQFWRLLEGQSFNAKYKLKKLLGFGAYGGVFLADEVIGNTFMRTVALKVILIDPDRRDSQIKELQISTALNHAYILRCFTSEIGNPNGMDCLGLVMELGDESLDKRLAKGVLAPDLVREMVKGWTSALQNTHSQSPAIIHRDLKPANILRVGNVWKISDFGVARLVGGKTASNTIHIAGSPAYMPPDAYNGEISPAFDMWSLGVIIVEMLTGKLPFNAMTVQELQVAVQSQEPQIEGELPAPFDQIVKGCLIKDRKERWTSQQVIDALNSPPEPIEPNESIRLQQVNMNQRDNNDQSRKGRNVLVALGLLAAISGMFLLFFAFKQPDPIPKTVSVNKDISPSDNLDKINAESSDNLDKVNAESTALLSKAKEFAGKNLLENAIAIVNKIDPRSSVYVESQKLMNQWSENLLKIATLQYEEQGKLTEASTMLKSIPANSLMSKKAYELTNKWQIEWKNNESNKTEAENALKENRWSDALLFAQKVTTPYWKKQSESIIQKATLGLAPIQELPKEEKASIKPFPTIKSQVGINYEKLIQLLSKEKFREADQETLNIILEVSKKSGLRWAKGEWNGDRSTIKQFPCEDLKTIDSLWRQYSSDRFGYSIQNGIWEGMGGAVGEYQDSTRELWENYNEKIGTKNRGYNNLIFSLSAPYGHLPALTSGFNVDFSIMRIAAANCNLR